MRSDELAIELIQGLMKSLPALEYKLIDDVIVGNAVPEAEQGLQFGRIIAAKALGIEVPGITINRYCASGLESIAMATAKIRTGMADCIIAGGTESMSMVPTAGWKTVPAYSIAKDEPRSAGKIKMRLHWLRTKKPKKQLTMVISRKASCQLKSQKPISTKTIRKQQEISRWIRMKVFALIPH
jgi:acetyl-CoA acetyltransferase